MADNHARFDFRHVFLGQAKDLPIRKSDMGDFINEWGLSIAAPYLQVVQMGDDYGSQNGTMFSPDMFKELIKPYNIVAPANNITADIPPENIVYLYEFAKSYSWTIA